MSGRGLTSYFGRSLTLLRGYATDKVARRLFMTAA